MSASTQWTATDIVFGSVIEAPLRRFSTSVAGEYRVAEDWTLSLGAGVSPQADLVVRGERFDFSPGPIGVLGVSYRIVAGEGWIPFVMLSGAGSFTTAKTRGALSLDEARLTAIDARVALTAGEVFADTFAPYASIRGFGGPVLWELAGVEINGTDKYHYAVGLGALVTAGWIDAFFEVVPIGERSLNAGAAFTF